MKLQGKNILIVSPEPWEHLFVSKHHYAVELARRGNRVFFLNPPGNSYQICDSSFPGLRVIEYSGFWKGLRLLPRVLRFHNQATVYNRLEDIAGTRFDVIWSFDNSVFFDFDALPNNVFKISHIVDYNQDFEFNRASRTAKLCLGVTSGIVKRQKKLNLNSHFVNHGFSKPQLIKSELTVNSEKLKIGYGGNLALKFIDWKTLNHVISRFDMCDFYFAGPGYLPESHENAYQLGALEKNDLYNFYRQMDVLLLCYRSDKYPDQVANSHKILEYLSTGKPIVASFTADYEHLDLLCMSRSNKDWIDVFEKVIEDIDYYNSINLQEKRKEFAYRNSYHKLLDRIEQMMK